MSSIAWSPADSTPQKFRNACIVAGVLYVRDLYAVSVQAGGVGAGVIAQRVAACADHQRGREPGEARSPQRRRIGGDGLPGEVVILVSRRV